MKNIILSFFLIISIEGYSQNRKDDFLYLTSNTISGGLISGINSCFHKKSNVSLSKTFIKAFWKGCIGGSINFTANKLVQESSFHNNYNYIWPARFVHSLGTSIIYNASYDKKILESYQFQFYCFNIIYDKKFEYRLDPVSISSFIFLSLNNNFAFNPKTSLQTGSLFFDKKGIIPFTQLGVSGKNMGNTIYRKLQEKVIARNRDITDLYPKGTYPEGVRIYTAQFINITIDKSTVCHEIIHSFQYEEYGIFNGITTEKIKGLNKFYINTNFLLVYLASSSISGGNSKNIFEREADYFGLCDYRLK